MNLLAPRGRLHLAGLLLARLEQGVLCLLLVAMIGLACLQIVLRSLFDSGLLWIDPLLRNMVLWSGLLGAAMATSRGSHIAIDLAGYLVPPRLQPLVRLLCQMFSTAAAGALTWASILFIKSGMSYGGPGLFKLPEWVWGLIFPLAFGLITLRYLRLAAVSAIGLLHPQPPQPDVRLP